MALTEVWWHGPDGEWKRTNADEADREYKYTISADSCTFRCYKCFQYVTFVKQTDRFVSHFRHSAGETNKDCEDRSSNLYTADYHASPLVEFPLRLTMDGSRARIALGVPPVNKEDIQRLMNQNGILRIANARTTVVDYRVDFSRFIPNTTCWFELSLGLLLTYSATFLPAAYTPALWKLKTPLIPSIGALFEARTGRRVTEKGDVEVGKEYYLLRKRTRSFRTEPSDVTIMTYKQDSQWTVYKIKANRLSDRASDFFFDELHMRLTQQPSDIDIVWPPCVQHDDLIDTKQSRLIVYVRGEQDLQTFPLSGNWSTLLMKRSNTQKFYAINNRGTLQMICAERFSQTLRCLYVRPLEEPEIHTPEAIKVMGADSSIIIEYSFTKLPAERTLRFLSPVDGSVTVSDRDGFCYRKPLPAGEETRITDLKKDMVLTLRQATKIVGMIMMPQNVARESSLLPNALPWQGRTIPFPARYAAILRAFPRESKAYLQLIEALKKGEIPEKGYLAIRKILEGKA